ncbi:MAG TPA: hypothetical protein VGR69_04125 [Candidatus Rubrimentiphilum sp.]|nr:hypothetical protein [Candidatus Rubrimentiphilum sp.]
MEVERFSAAHGTLAVRLDAPEANRVLLALERLDQQSGLDPVLAELREALRGALVTKSSGDTDSAPSTE